MQAVGSSLNDADLVVQAFHEAERHFVFGLAVSGDAIPVSIDHLGEFLVGFKPLPLQTRPPVLEESPRPALAFVVPELTKGLPEQVRRIQALVRRQHLLERLAAFEREVLAMRKQRVLLALDVVSILAAESAVLGLAHLVERVAQMAQYVELVVQDRRPRCARRSHVVKRLPHVHHRQANPTGLLLAQPVVEQRHTRLFSVLSPEPDRAPSNQVAHHDAIDMAFADRDLVDSNHSGGRRSSSAQLLPHILLLQLLDGLPIQVRFLGNVLDGRDTATPSHEEGEAFRIERILREPIQLLLFHLAASLAVDTSNLQFQVDPSVPTRQVAYSAQLAVVPGSTRMATDSADSFFPRRWRRTTLAFGSPNMPCTVELGRKRGKRYVSHRRRYLRILKSCQFSRPVKQLNIRRAQTVFHAKFAHSQGRRT